MTAASKGAAAEREVALILTKALGIVVRRKLGAGRFDDEGDLEASNFPVTLQVAWWPTRGVLRAVREKPVECERQRVNAGNTYCASLIRMLGGEWRVVLTIDQWANYVKGVLADGDRSVGSQ